MTGRRWRIESWRIVSWRGVGLLALTSVVAAIALHAGAQERILLDPETAHRKVEAGELTLIDVRRPSEWAETGVPAGARTMTMHGPKGIEGLLDEIDAMTGGDKNAPIALICHSGTRSSRVRAALAERGYRKAYDVSAGVVGSYFTPGWIARGLPTRPVDPDAETPDAETESIAP